MALRDQSLGPVAPRSGRAAKSHRAARRVLARRAMPTRLTASWYPYLVHLRLHYQLVFLSPLFAWGLLIGGVQLSTRLLIGFISFHVFLYGGITAFNSCYDHDLGPIGGLRSPPKAPRWLLPFSLVIQLIGLVLAIAVSLQFTSLYLAVVVLSMAYSHPHFRWKARPILSLLVVAFGQGAVGFAAGWACSAAAFSALLGLEGVLGLASATLSTVGIFPLTQLYQIAEDRERGDRTFAVAFGAQACFRFTLWCLFAAGASMVTLSALRFGVSEAILLAIGYVSLLAIIDSWRRHFRAEVFGNFELLHRLQFGLSAAMFGYMVLVWVRQGTPVW